MEHLEPNIVVKVKSGSTAKIISPRFTLGAGTSVTQQFYSVKTSPLLLS